MKDSEQIQFFQLVKNHAPQLLDYWNRNNTELDVNALTNYMKSCSIGERELARFFGSIWCGDNRFEFDLILATKILGRAQLNMLAKWCANPIFP